MSSVNMVAPGARNVGATTTAARRVAYIGSPGCYTEQAAVKFYHEKEVVELVPHHAVEEVCAACCITSPRREIEGNLLSAAGATCSGEWKLPDGDSADREHNVRFVAEL